MDNQIKTLRAQRAERLLETADAQLANAYQRLTAVPRQYGEANASLVDVIKTGVRAFLAWHGGDGMDEAPLSSQAERAVSLASILRTPLRRARKLIPVAERLRSQDDGSFSVGDREAVLEGFYAVRNLYFTLYDALPPAVRPNATLPPDAAVPVEGTSTRAYARTASTPKVEA